MDRQLENITAAQLIEQDAASLAFGRPVLMNTFRAVVAEVIIARALDARWRHCAADWNMVDFERDDGVALEVKQSAARQSWAKDGEKPSESSFDIAERKRGFKDDAWVNVKRRWADVYVFAHHPRTDAGTDHRQPQQWDFYVMPARELPSQQTINLGRIKKMATHSVYDKLAQTIDIVADRIGGVV